MRPYDPGRTLFSIHVPKCAGTSFTRVLSRWFRPASRWSLVNRLCPPRLFLHYEDEDGIPPVRHHPRSPGCCIHGHFNRARGFGVLDYYPDATQCIAILRDPAEIAISNYFYVRRRRKEQGGRGRLPASVNDMLRERHSFLLSYLPRPVTARNLERVLVEDFVGLGIAEELQATVDHFARILGREPVAVATENPSPRDEEIREEARAAFRRNAGLEYAVYEFARAQVLPWERR